MSQEKKVAVLGSGKGSNARSIIEAAREGRLGGEVAVVLSDVAEAGILGIAREFEIPALHVEPGVKGGGRLSDKALDEILGILKQFGVDLVALAGFMRIVREPLLSAYEGRMLNIHPSLLPKYPGLHTVKRAMEAGETETGCTIHLVDRGVDTGRILRQERVPILSGDSEDAVYGRIQEKEHRAFPEVIAQQLAALEK